MKKNLFYLILVVAGIISLAAYRPAERKTNGMMNGTPEIRSISAMSFGKDGMLFIGDSKSAAIIAFDTKDTKTSAKFSTHSMTGITQHIAALLGTQKENITITDMAVNPLSKKIYLAIQHSDGTPALLRLHNNTLEAVALKNIAYSTMALNDVVAEDAKDGRGRPLRVSTISDIGFDNGKVLVSGLSNKEFSSTFRSISFPFNKTENQTSLEIYHAAHGRYETSAPIRTFTTGKINGKDYLIASYTCTPLVLFPLGDLQPGAHLRGRTVAEMGSGNTPIDMITLQNGNESVLLMANTAKPVAQVQYKDIAAFEGTLTEKVSGTAGTSFVTIPLTGVVQMDKLDNKRMVLIQKNTNGDLDLSTHAAGQ